MLEFWLVSYVGVLDYELCWRAQSNGECTIVFAFVLNFKKEL